MTNFRHLTKLVNSIDFKQKIFTIKSKKSFDSLAIQLFNDQYKGIEVYKKYCDLIGKFPDTIKSIVDIPFLPISAFKNHEVLGKEKQIETTFKSSGTGNSENRSSHHIIDLSIYQESLLHSFRQFIGRPQDFIFYSLLPGYSENPDSSLIYMLDVLSKNSRDQHLHRFPSDHDALLDQLLKNEDSGLSSILFGVSFALMDLTEKCEVSLPNLTIVETGGMKGRRKEITRQELHESIRKKLNPGKIVSEYGMTELLSQAYAIDGTFFTCPPWMKVLVRESQDPLTVKNSGAGAINLIDLANINSCAFIASDDLGNLREDGSFEVLGRFDHSDIRGCNLLIN